MAQIWSELVQKFLVKEIKLMYAILDIESTGGKYNEESITEIAIYKFDGKKSSINFQASLILKKTFNLLFKN